MSDYTLRDLELAGVCWELAESPISTPVADKKEDIIVSSRPNVATVMAEIGRVATSIVPPVAPAQTMSLDTVRAMASRPTDMSTLNRMIDEFNHPLRASATNTSPP